MMVLKWKDKKDVTLLSTIHNAEMVDVTTRKGTIQKPKLVMDYNNTMGGVDRMDQHLSCYPTPRKRGKKYYKKIFFHLVDLAIWNSYVLYIKCGGKHTPLSFRTDLIKDIIGKYHSPTDAPRPGRPSQTETPLRLTERHFPCYVPATEKKNCPTRVCAVCTENETATAKKFVVKVATNAMIVMLDYV